MKEMTQLERILTLHSITALLNESMLAPWQTDEQADIIVEIADMELELLGETDVEIEGILRALAQKTYDELIAEEHKAQEASE